MQFSVDLTDGVVGDEDTAPACPAAASLPTLLAAALPSIKGDCFSGPSPTTCQSVSVLDAYSGCQPLGTVTGSPLTWYRCTSANGNGAIVAVSSGANNLGTTVYGGCVYDTTTPATPCQVGFCSDRQCALSNTAAIGTCTVPANLDKGNGLTCSGSGQGSPWTGSGCPGACAVTDGTCRASCACDTAWAFPTEAQLIATADQTTLSRNLPGPIMWYPFAENPSSARSAWGGAWFFNITSAPSSITVDIHAGAGRNDVTKGWIAGTLTLSYTPPATASVAPTVTFSGRFAQADMAATNLQVLVAYKSQVSVVSGAPGKFKDYTTYSPSPVYDANRLFGANSAPFTFTASPKTVKNEIVFAAIHFDAVNLYC